MFRKYYLAYGSNLNLQQMLNRCPGAIPVGTTILFNHHLVFKGNQDGAAYLTIEPKEGAYVPLGIYSISVLDEKKLDLYEGYPESYKKEYIGLNIRGKKVLGMVYVMNNEFEYHLPSNQYFETCLKGYKDFGFNTALLKKAILDTSNGFEKTK